ncbi:imm11 family protein [Deinococcus multiflagellatus]|uniref:Imm11 family protein n=1 Tax=Deinococcus multiflagellatus TaxID=1656887 RepID=A0ABW1ZVA5_9DEIO|nr:DUF1629 domain-containing protein [Deinococcus multiflagellatus]MBZ9716197.1 hypothetical protein [Deinococcus multiflagellatus]
MFYEICPNSDDLRFSAAIMQGRRNRTLYDEFDLLSEKFIFHYDSEFLPDYITTDTPLRLYSKKFRKVIDDYCTDSDSHRWIPAHIISARSGESETVYIIDLPLVDVLNYNLTQTTEVKISLPNYNPPDTVIITHPVIDRHSAQGLSIFRQLNLLSTAIVSEGLANALLDNGCTGCAFLIVEST